MKNLSYYAFFCHYWFTTCSHCLTFLPTHFDYYSSCVLCLYVIVHLSSSSNHLQSSPLIYGLQSIGQSYHKSDIAKVIFLLSGTPIIKMMQCNTTFPCAMCISMTRFNVFINYCNYFFILSSLIHYMFPLLNLLANSFWLFFFMCSLSVCNCTFVQLFHSFAVFHINNGLQSIGQSNHKSDIEKSNFYTVQHPYYQNDAIQHYFSLC